MKFAEDIAVFTLALLIPITVGLYFALRGGKQRTTNEFLLANKNLRSWLISLSLVASYFSSVVLLGTTAEVFFLWPAVYYFSAYIILDRGRKRTCSFYSNVPSTEGYLRQRVSRSAIFGSCTIYWIGVIYHKLPSVLERRALSSISSYQSCDWCSVSSRNCPHWGRLLHLFNTGRPKSCILDQRISSHSDAGGPNYAMYCGCQQCRRI